MSQQQETVTADVVIVGEYGSDCISDFAYLKEGIGEDVDAQRVLKVWYDEHEGEPDEVYPLGMITEIKP